MKTHCFASFNNVHSVDFSKARGKGVCTRLFHREKLYGL